jgi:hypothetical protein
MKDERVGERKGDCASVRERWGTRRDRHRQRKREGERQRGEKKQEERGPRETEREEREQGLEDSDTPFPLWQERSTPPLLGNAGEDLKRGGEQLRRTNGGKGREMGWRERESERERGGGEDITGIDGKHINIRCGCRTCGLRS